MKYFRLFVEFMMFGILLVCIYTNSVKIKQLQRVLYSKDREIIRLNTTIALTINGSTLGEAWEQANSDFFGPADPPLLKAQPVIK